MSPGPTDSLLEQAGRYQAAGQIAEAIAAYRSVLGQEPERAEIYLLLGGIWHNDGQLGRAALCYRTALVFCPASPAALLSLGHLAVLAGMQGIEPDLAADQATLCYERSLVLVPDLATPNRYLAQRREAEGRLLEAALHRRQLARPQPLIQESRPDATRSLLLLSAAGDGNIPFESLLPAQVNRRIIWNIEFATAQQEADLPPYDLVFNLIGNADLAAPAYLPTEAFRRRCRRPFLNLPDQVAKTRRDLMPALLGALPGLVVPKVLRLDRQALGSGQLQARLSEGGIGFPCLMRPIGGQGGWGLKRFDCWDDLQQAQLPMADALYFIAFHDYRSADGFYRKYRTIFVDRQPYPYHLAISSHWLVHYFSADMTLSDWKRAEEQRFLENPDLGDIATQALANIGRQLDLDYGGVDYSLLPDGRLLVFEANATMSVYLPSDAVFAYKQKPVQAIFAAVETMLKKSGESHAGL